MLIHNAVVVTWGKQNAVLNDHAVWIQDGKIADMGPSDELQKRYAGAEAWDAGGQLLMPGNICAHTHFYGAFSRGMAIPGSPAKDFPQILEKLWWPLDKSLHAEDVRYSAFVCLADAIRHGTTTLIDHHASPNAISGSLDIIADAVDEAGVRAVLCYEVTDRDGKEKARAGIEENVRFIKRCASEQVADGRVAATFGLHANLTLSEDTLKACREAAPEESGFHIHVAEHEADEYDSIAKSGLRCVDRLAKHDMLGPHSIVVHGVHIDTREIQLLAETDTWLTHQPRSNMNNGVGISDVESILRAGVKVCLGNDGFSNDMWEEWKTAYLVHKVWRRDPRRMPGDLIARIAVENNAALAETFFPGVRLGVIEPGAAADLMMVDYHPPTPLSGGNLPWHIIFGFHGSMVTGTISAGKVLMRDRKLLTLDLAAIAARSRELVPAVWERYLTFAPAN